MLFLAGVIGLILGVLVGCLLISGHFILALLAALVLCFLVYIEEEIL